MESFEIHITGSKNILDVLNDLNFKSLHAEMRNPSNETVGVEYMSSFVSKFDNYETCKNWVDDFVLNLENNDVDIYRVKIECPYFYSHYRDQSIYLEVHFPTTDDNKEYPFVYNIKSGKYVSTDRIFLKSDYDNFISKWEKEKNTEIEYCLYDDNIMHDIDWIKSFKKI